MFYFTYAAEPISFIFFVDLNYLKAIVVACFHTAKRRQFILSPAHCFIKLSDADKRHLSPISCSVLLVQVFTFRQNMCFITCRCEKGTSESV